MNDRLIGIDFEYNAGDTLNDNLKLICCALGDRCYWLNDDSDKDALIHAIEYYDIHGYTFVCHCLHLAEARCFIKLGLNPMNYDWIDTWLMLVVGTNNASCVNQSILSLANATKDVLEIDIDTKEKDMCREYCINYNSENVERHKQDIMTYCLHDVSNLPKLVYGIKDKYKVNHDELYILFRSECAFANIASHGLPVNRSRLEVLLKELPKFVSEEKRKYIIEGDNITNKFYKYEPAKPAVYYKSKPDMIRFKAKEEKFTFYREVAIQNLINYLKQNGFTFPAEKNEENKKDISTITDSCTDPHGRHIDFSLDKKFLGNFVSGFPAELLKHKKLLNGIQSFVKNYEPSDRIYYETLSPFGSKTGRCQPSPKRGFIPLLSKDFYCVLEPPVGKVLFEFDYSAQETFIQACVYNDDNMLKIYQSKDPYLWLMMTLGEIPKEEFETLSKSELKEKYAERRQQIKAVQLGWSYGAGAQTLSTSAGISFEEAKNLITRLNETFAKTVNGRDEIVNDTWDVINEPDENGVIVTKRKILPPIVLSDGFRMNRVKDESPLVIGNFPIQGRGAEILRRLCINLESNPVTAGCCIATIHDAVVCECEEGKSEAVKDAVLSEMKKAAEEVLGQDGIRASLAFEIHHGQALYPDGHTKMKNLINADPVET